MTLPRDIARTSPLVLVTFGDEDLNLARRFTIDPIDTISGAVFRAQFWDTDLMLAELTNADASLIVQDVPGDPTSWDVFFFLPQAQLELVEPSRYYQWRLRIERPDGTTSLLVEDGVWHHFKSVVRAV